MSQIKQPQFAIRAEFAGRIRWNSRGSCGNSGCTDPKCCCSLCGKPIGVSEEDPRWEEHSEYCDGCELCRDQVPFIMFAGEGKRMKQAQFCTACLEKAIEVTA